MKFSPIGAFKGLGPLKIPGLACSRLRVPVPVAVVTLAFEN